MLENWTQSLRSLLTISSQNQKLSKIWALNIVNFFLIGLLGSYTLLHLDYFPFFWIIGIGGIGLGTLIAWLLIKPSRFLSIGSKDLVEDYEKIQLPLLIVTHHLDISYKNKKACEICWWAENIPSLKQFLTSPESMEAFNRLMENLYKKEEIIEVLSLKGKNEEEMWQIYSRPIKKGCLWQCIHINDNGSESSEGMFSINEQETVLFCNDKFAQWLGYTREDIVGAPLSKFFAKEHNALSSSKIQRTVNFTTSSSRLKTAFLEQRTLPLGGEALTYFLVKIDTFLEHSNNLKEILEVLPLPIIWIDKSGRVQDANLLFQKSFFEKKKSIQGTPFLDLVANFQKKELQEMLQNFLQEKSQEISLEVHLKDERNSIVSAHFSSIFFHNCTTFIVVFYDITDQKWFQNQLVQAQKVQAVGQLAGGIAHDFNNLLTVMIGFCDLMLMRHTPGDPSFSDIMQVKQNANRATNLVRQLLAFSRQETLKPQVLSVRDCFAELSALLRRLIEANIELTIHYVREESCILVNPGQFEQMIINLVVNAKDAIKGTGNITLNATHYDGKRAKRLSHGVMPAGSYVLIEVTDTGEGISPEVISNIFDPFFSTKGVGEGTGLGLSTVQGVVKQTGGFIHIQSKVGEGTTFSIYLPRYMGSYKESIEFQEKEKQQRQDLTGSGNILLVEDEDAVRLFSARALRSKGYKVFEAMNGEEALEFINRNEKKIDLIISDVIMPHMDGPTFINQVKQLHPTPKVLFISGYAEDTFHNRLLEDQETQLLAKPFSLEDLAFCVKEILSEKDTTSFEDIQGYSV